MRKGWFAQLIFLVYSKSGNLSAGPCIRSLMPTRSSMFGFKRDREKDRFYLLPGMGGRAYRRKQNLFLKVSILVGILAGAAVALIMWYAHSAGQ